MINMKSDKSEEPTDDTITELHRIRRELVASHNGDLAALTADAQKRAQSAGRVIVDRREMSDWENKDARPL